MFHWVNIGEKTLFNGRLFSGFSTIIQRAFPKKQIPLRCKHDVPPCTFVSYRPFAVGITVLQRPPPPFLLLLRLLSRPRNPNSFSTLGVIGRSCKEVHVALSGGHLAHLKDHVCNNNTKRAFPLRRMSLIVVKTRYIFTTCLH